MEADTHNTFVLSLGGALIVPGNQIDTQFLKAFTAFIRNQVSEKKRRFFITVGGGDVMRQYRDAAKEVRNEVEDADLDWLGIHATRLNAQLIRTILKDIANPKIIKHYEIILKVTEPVAVAAGWKPGWSTDFCAVTLCEDYGISQVINMTNVDRVYTKDPKKFPDATPVENMTWKEYREIVGTTWSPGLHAPFDPIASKKAMELGLTVRIVNGMDLKNLELVLDGKPFIGTTIQ